MEVRVRTDADRVLVDHGPTWQSIMQERHVMNIRSHHMRPVLCAALAALTTAAAAGVNKCVDDNGEILYTDMDCPDGSHRIDPASSNALRYNGMEHIAPDAAAAITPRSPWADMPHPIPRHDVSLDASTLQTARLNLQVLDQARRRAHLVSSR